MIDSPFVLGVHFDNVESKNISALFVHHLLTNICTKGVFIFYSATLEFKDKANVFEHKIVLR